MTSLIGIKPKTGGLYLDQLYLKRIDDQIYLAEKLTFQILKQHLDTSTDILRGDIDASEFRHPNVHSVNQFDKYEM